MVTAETGKGQSGNSRDMFRSMITVDMHRSMITEHTFTGQCGNIRDRYKSVR